MNSEEKITDLKSQIMSLLKSLKEIKKMNSFGKTKQIADEIQTILDFYNR